MQSITWKIGGEAGFGIMTTGLMFSKIAVRHGYNIFDYVEYPSLIRGGHNVYEVRVSDKKVYSQEKGVDFLFALHRQAIDLHKNELKDGAIVVYDKDLFNVDPGEFSAKNVICYPLPLKKLITDSGLNKVMENNIALGATMAIFSMDINVLYGIIEGIFKKKGPEIIDKNKIAANTGFDYVKKNPPIGFTRKLPLIEQKMPQMIIAGNDAIGMGAIAGGCNFFVAYPMTPASSLFHFMASHAAKCGMIVKHAEDEISVINMAVGAGYAGARVMTGTAGGGYALMVEGTGLAAITETPIVIIVAQRPGPATGMPTWTGQGDLQFIIHAAQDEFPRIVLTPGDMDELFYLTAQSFNLAQVYQIPVFIMTDKYLAESHSSINVYDISKMELDYGKLLSWEEGDTIENYLRYEVTEDGIPKRALPGMKNATFVANSYEHDEYGWSSEDKNNRILQMDRRQKKMEKYIKSIPRQNVYGESDADLTIVAWGSTKGPVLSALDELKSGDSNLKVNFLHITHAWPFPKENVENVLSKSKKILLIEGNSYSQMGALIREQTGIYIKDRYLKYDGRPFYPEDIIAKIKEVVSK
jgi:2-oxoglutarate/2-oxoacid ferredoxin oxidoreductase subunit alpha